MNTLPEAEIKKLCKANYELGVYDAIGTWAEILAKESKKLKKSLSPLSRKIMKNALKGDL